MIRENYNESKDIWYVDYIGDCEEIIKRTEKILADTPNVEATLKAVLQAA